MSGDEAVRKEFEAWATGPKLPLQSDGRLYAEYMTQLAWMTWQASRSAAIDECADKLQMFHDAIIPNSVCVSTAQYVLKAGRKAIIDLKDVR